MGEEPVQQVVCFRLADLSLVGGGSKHFAILQIGVEVGVPVVTLLLVLDHGTVIVVSGIQIESNGDLLDVAEVLRLLRGLLRLGKHREEDCCQDGDDRDDDQEFDQGETTAAAHISYCIPW